MKASEPRTDPSPITVPTSINHLDDTEPLIDLGPESSSMAQPVTVTTPQTHSMKEETKSGESHLGVNPPTFDGVDQTDLFKDLLNQFRLSIPKDAERYKKSLKTL